MINRLFFSCIMSKITNLGKGAGGKNTNINGLSYEEFTNLNKYYDVMKEEKFCKIIKFKDYDNIYISTNKSNLFKYMLLHNKLNTKINNAHGCKNPDECYIDNILSNIFIIEKKFQQIDGSVCEKIQTIDFKLWQYQRLFPSFNIIYIYCLSEWFKKNCKAELEYLKIKKIPIFYGNDIKYKMKIIKFITSYK